MFAFPKSETHTGGLGKEIRKRDHPLRHCPTQTVGILGGFLTCRALLTPFCVGESIGGVVSPRGTRIKTASRFLRAIEARRTAMS